VEEFTPEVLHMLSENVVTTIFSLLFVLLAVWTISTVNDMILFTISIHYLVAYNMLTACCSQKFTVCICLCSNVKADICIQFQFSLLFFDGLWELPSTWGTHALCALGHYLNSLSSGGHKVTTMKETWHCAWTKYEILMFKHWRCDGLYWQRVTGDEDEWLLDLVTDLASCPVCIIVTCLVLFVRVRRWCAVCWRCVEVWRTKWNTMRFIHVTSLHVFHSLRSVLT